MALYADIFANYAVPVGQVLLTRDDLKHRARYINARNTFEALFNVGALPIVNENDTTATDEIRVGDNDTLAALVASLLNADALILLSDVQGLYDKNPAQYADAKLVETVSDIDTVRQFAGGAGSPGGTGGMKTKIVAAEIATCSGVALWIAHGKRPDVLHECLSHAHQAGTYFAPSQTRPSARKRWLAWAGGTPKGILTVNEHARRALVEANGSLLPVGIVHVGGDFVSGDFVAIADEAGTVFARGIARHKADQVRRVAGKTSSEIAQIAGEANKIGAVIHRDALVLVLGA
jgi:glutamate 5-kinase